MPPQLYENDRASNATVVYLPMLQVDVQRCTGVVHWAVLANLNGQPKLLSCQMPQCTRLQLSCPSLQRGNTGGLACCAAPVYKDVRGAEGLATAHIDHSINQQQVCVDGPQHDMN